MSSLSSRMARLARRLTAALNGSVWGHVAAAVILALMLAAYFSPVLLHDRLFTGTATQQGFVYPWAATPSQYPFALQSDQSDLSMPALAVQQRAYEEGELPFIDLYSYGGGNVLFADFATGQGYPPRMLVAVLFDPIDAHLVFTLGHVFAAGLFTYLFVRRLGGRWLAGLLAGSSWMFGSWTLGWMQLAPFVVVSALLPSSLWAMHRLVERRTLNRVVVAASLLGANLVAGHALFGLVSAAVVGVYGLCLFGRQLVREQPTSGRRSAVRSAAVMPGVAALAALLWAFSLIPLALASRDSARSANTFGELRNGQLATARDLLTTLWPYRAPVNLREFNGLAFVGFACGALAVVGMFCRRPGSGLGRTLVLGMSAVMIGGPITWLVFRLVPTMDIFRPYTRLAMFLGFGVVMLAAAGFEVVATFVSTRLNASGRDGLRPILFAAVALAIGINALNLLHYGRDNNPSFPPGSTAAVLPDTPLISALRHAASSNTSGWPGRAVAISPLATPSSPWSPPQLWAAAGSWIGVETASGYNSTMSRRTQRMLRVLTGEALATVAARDGIGAYVPEFWWSLARSELFPRNGYDLVVTPPSLDATSPWGRQHVATGELVALYDGPDGHVYRIAGATAGPHSVNRVEAVASDDAALARFTDPSFDAATTVLLSRADAAREEAAGIGASPAVITGATREVNGYAFTATVSASTLLVVPENWDPGWSATIDGHPARLMRGNSNQLVLRVPAGAAVVRLQYRPPGFDVGRRVTGLTIAGLVAAAITMTAQRRRGTTVDAAR